MRTAPFANPNATAMPLNLGGGLRNYRDVHGTFPPPFIADKDGKPMHSWRVLLLPYMDYQDLYAEYDLNEPWDSEKNLRLLSKMPNIYRCPNCQDSTHTHYFVVVGPSTLFPSTPSDGKTDSDYSTTIAIVENNHQSIQWTEPRDLAEESLDAVLSHAEACDPQGYCVVMGDGQVYRGLTLDGGSSIAPLVRRDNEIDMERLKR